jgi:cell division protein FtsQ
MVPEETLERAAVDDVSPRYLRKQKPAQVKRRRSRQAPSSGSRFRRGALAFLIVTGASALAGAASYLFFFSPAVTLRPGRVEISGEHYVSRQRLLSVFSADMGRSVVRVPLDRRLASIDEIPWVRRATVERVLPNRLVVHVVERNPVALLATNAGMKLIDVDGVILDRPSGASFNLPVVTGIGTQTPVAERAKRVALFAEFLKQIAKVSPKAPSEVSEANLSSPDDVQVTLAGAPVLAGQGPVVVRFGNSDFAHRFQEFLENFGAWKVRAGNVESVDLRYDGQALVTPGSPMATPAAPTPPSDAVPQAQAQPGGRQGNEITFSETNGKRSARQ